MKSMFFNSVQKDRVYSADDFGEIFEGLYTDGVIKGYKSELAAELRTRGDGGYAVLIKPGKAWFNGTWTIVDNYGEGMLFPIDANPYNRKRTDLVILEVNKTPSVRENTIKLIKGDYPEIGDQEMFPPLINNESVHQYILAKIVVSANTTDASSSRFFAVTNLIGSADVVNAAQFSEAKYISKDIDPSVHDIYFYKRVSYAEIGDLPVPALSAYGVASPTEHVICSTLPSHYTVVDVTMTRAWPRTQWAPMYIPYWTTRINSSTGMQEVVVVIYSSATEDQYYACDFTITYTK